MDGVLLQFSHLDPSTRWWLIIAATLTVLYAIMRPLRRRKDPLERNSKTPSLAGQRAVERDLNNLVVELSEMARQITAQLDTRALKLEMLIKEADQRVAALQRASQASRSAEPLPAAGHAEVPPPPVDPRHVEIYVLADQGHTAHQIAQRLDRPHGEIELILALREQPAGEAL